MFDNEGRARAVIEALMRAGVLEGVNDERRAQLIAESKKALDALALPEPERARELGRILEEAASWTSNQVRRRSSCYGATTSKRTISPWRRSAWSSTRMPTNWGSPASR